MLLGIGVDVYKRKRNQDRRERERDDFNKKFWEALAKDRIGRAKKETDRLKRDKNTANRLSVVEHWFQHSLPKLEDRIEKLEHWKRGPTPTVRTPDAPKDAWQDIVQVGKM